MSDLGFFAEPGKHSLVSVDYSKVSQCLYFQLIYPSFVVTIKFEQKCNKNNIVMSIVLVVQRFGVGLVIERSLVRLPAGALSSQLGQLKFRPAGVAKSSTSLHDWVRRGAFIYVGWQVTSCSSEMGFP